jgi:hypothetical protein
VAVAVAVVLLCFGGAAQAQDGVETTGPCSNCTRTECDAAIQCDVVGEPGAGGGRAGALGCSPDSSAAVGYFLVFSSGEQAAASISLWSTAHPAWAIACAWPGHALCGRP